MALGKKLDSLLENYFGPTSLEDQNDVLTNIAISRIQVSPHQPRSHFDNKSLKALAKNIADHGLLQPVTVIELETGNYQLISGERRLRAVTILGRAEIQAIVKNKTNLGEKQQATLSIFENLHRENLSPMDTARAYLKLKELHNWSNQELADFLSYSKQYIDNHLKLLNLSPKVQTALSNNQLTEGHARFFHALNFENQDKILDEIIQKQLSVKETSKLINNLFKPKPSKPVLHPEVKFFINQLQARFPKTKVSLNGTKQRGSLIIKWTKSEDFPEI